MLYTQIPGNTKHSIQVSSRRFVDLLHPSPDVVTIDDLVAGLSVPRFRNQTTTPITVIDHSTRCARIALALDQPTHVVIACLLHDAPEAYLGDLPGPIKHLISITIDDIETPWSVLESRWSEAIITALVDRSIADRIIGLIDDPGSAVYTIDKLALALESLSWMPGAETWSSEAISAFCLEDRDGWIGGRWMAAVIAAMHAPGPGAWAPAVRRCHQILNPDESLHLVRSDLEKWLLYSL